MKLTTIWTLRGIPLAERLRRTGDWAAQAMAARIPARVRYWTFIQVGSAAMPDGQVVPDARFMDLLARAEGGPR